MGTASADEWFWGASWLRFDPVATLDASVLEAPFAADAAAAGAFSPSAVAAATGLDAEDLARGELDLFFSPTAGFGPLRGYLDRDYDEEVIIGASMKYVFTGMMKIYEDATPATYMVAQWMHKTESDMFGRHLSGNGSDSSTGGVPTGDDQFNAVAFAVQQPFPNLIWRADLSVLYDLEGGILVQPGVRWRPRDDFQLDLYANVLDSDGGNDDIMGTLETMDEVFLRASYYF